MNSKISSIFTLALIKVAAANELPLQEDMLQEDRFEDEKGYFGQQGYQMGLSAEEKLHELWKMIIPDENVIEEPMGFMWKEFDNFFSQRSNTSFYFNSDELRQKRLKTTHTQGVVAKVEWRPVSNEEGVTFSGIYEHGSQHAIIRLSEARNLTEASVGLLPSLALKFLIDYKKSENLFAMPNFTGLYENEETSALEPSWDFFKAPMKNRVDRLTDPCEQDTVERKLIEGHRFAYMTAVSRPARMATDGVVIDQEDSDAHRFPFQLEYEGVHHFPNNGDEVWYNRLKDHFNSKFGKDEDGDGVVDDVPLMKVFAWDAPEELGGRRVQIAEIILKTPLYTSQAGDKRLFFQHKGHWDDRMVWPRSWQKLNPDLKFEKNWDPFPGINTWPTTDDEAAREKYLESIQPDENGNRGCPFTWLWN